MCALKIPIWHIRSTVSAAESANRSIAPLTASKIVVMVVRSVSFTPRPYPAIVPVALRDERAISEFAVPSDKVDDAPVMRFHPLKVAVRPVRRGISSLCANSISGVLGTSVAIIFRENHAKRRLFNDVVVLFVSAI